MLLIEAISISTGLKKNRISPRDFLKNAIAQFCRKIKKSQTLD